MSNEVIDTKSAHITPADGNVFADLGFSPQEAEQLHTESLRIIEAKLAIKQSKDSLLNEITGWIDSQNLKQSEADRKSVV